MIINPYVLASGGISTPSDLTDIWDWWEPSRQGGYSNGDELTGLTGQKNARNFTRTVVGQAPLYDTTHALNGLAVCDSQSKGVAQLFGPDMSALTAAHMFIVVKVATQANNNGLWHMGSDGSFPAFAYTDNNIYENAFRNNDRPNMGNPVLSLNNWRIYEISSITNEWIVRLDGTQQSSTQTTNTVGPVNNPRIGHNGSAPVSGWWAGAYLASAKLSTPNRTALIGYLNTRFGFDTPQPFFKTFSAGSPRNNFAGYIGVSFANRDPIQITHLARWKVSGNSQVHTLKLLKSDDTVLATASFDASGGTTGAYNYVAITPVTLAAGTSYKVVSQEFNGGDQWLDEGAATYENIASSEAIVFGNIGSWNAGASNENWGGVDFKYLAPKV